MAAEEIRPRVVMAVLVPLAASALWSARDAPPAATTFAPQLTVVAATPAPPPEIVIPPAVPPDRPACPPPRRDAPWVAPVLPEPIDDVRPAPSNAGWIAAWNTRHVFVSHDAGATFARVLDGAGDVIDASFDCYGRLVVLRGERVGVRDGSGERWRDVPRLDRGATADRHVLGGGPDVVVLGPAPGDGRKARVAISADAAATWRYEDIDAAFEGGQGEQRADGAIDVAVVTGDCMDDLVTWATIRGRDVATTAVNLAEGAPSAIYGDLLVTSDAWTTRSGTWTPVAAPDHARLAPVPGAFPVLVTTDRAYRLVHGKLEDLHVTLDGVPRAVDLAGRVWTIACGKPLVARRTTQHVAETCEAGD